MKRARRVVLSGILLSVIIGAVFYLIGSPRLFGGPFEAGVDERIRLPMQVYEHVEQANEELARIWREYHLFSWQWWVLVGLQVVPWLVWAWIRPRESTHRLLYIGTVLMVISFYLDFLGTTLGLWRYYVDVIPSIPSFVPWDSALYPVAGMLIFQYEPRLSKYLKALLFACLATLVVEPFFVWLKFYEPTHWSAFYSLPIHYLIYLIADWFGTRTTFQPLDRQAAARPRKENALPPT